VREPECMVEDAESTEEVMHLIQADSKEEHSVTQINFTLVFLGPNFVPKGQT
jgi:predicted small metal-binding protein